MTTLRELRDKRNGIYAQAQEFNIRHQAGERLSAADEAAWSRALDDVDRLGVEIENRERTEQLGTRFSGVDDRQRDHVPTSDGSGREARFGRPLGRTARFADLPDCGSNDPAGDANAFWRALATGDYRSLPDHLELRAGQSESIGSEGGYLVPDTVAANVWDRTRNKAVTQQAGVQVVPLDGTGRGSHTLPKLTGDATPAWIAEEASVPESAITFGATVLQPQALAVLVKVSMQLLQDSAVDAGSVINDALARVFAVELDRVTLRGSGVGAEPTGARNWPTVGTTGSIATPTYDDLIDGIFEVREANYECTGIIGAHRDAKTLAKLREGSGTGAWLPAPEVVAQTPRYWTNQVPTDLGTGDDESEMYFGQWDQAVLAVRLGFQVAALRERYADTLQVGLLAYVRADVGVVSPSAFHVLTGVTA